MKASYEGPAMKAMILAAGLGTRLGPLTANRPKALVEVAGRTLLEITLSRLSSFGVRDVIINVHHFADMILKYLKANGNFGLRIEISHEELLLDTGGGLKKASWFFLRDSSEEPFLLHNVDVLSAIDLGRMTQFHKEKHALATLAVQDRETSRYLLFDEKFQLCGRRAGRDGMPEMVCSRFTNTPQESTTSAVPRNSRASAPQAQWQALAFSGIHVISPRLLTKMTEEGAFSIVDTYLHLAARGENIFAFLANEYYWRDLGRPDDLKQATEDLKQGIVL
jgi:NDP-sugar pyrophosphorylase family protein